MGKPRNRDRKSKKTSQPTTTTSNNLVMGTQVRSPLKVVYFPGVGFPDRLGTCLRYDDQYNLAGGVPTPNAQVWLLNSLYDPDSTGTGHQPQCFDQLTAIYNKYMVYAVDYNLEIYNAATSPARWVVSFNESDISGRTVEQIAETKYVHTGILGVTGGGEPLTFVKGRCELSTLMGQKLLDPDSTMYANYNASPSDGAFMICKVSSLDGVANANVYVRAQLHYHAFFKDRTEASASLSKDTRHIKNTAKALALPPPSTERVASPNSSFAAGDPNVSGNCNCRNCLGDPPRSTKLPSL